MGMGTDDRIGTIVEQKGSKLLLPAVLLDLVFVAPVHGDQDEIGLCGFSFLKIAPDQYCIDAIDDNRRTVRDTVCSICIIQESDPYALLLHDQGVICCPGFRIREGAGLNNPFPVKYFDGSVHSLRPSVQCMVIGIDKDIKTSPFQGACQFIRTGECRIALVGCPGKSDLKVPDHQVSLRQVRSQELETGFIIISGITGSQGGGNLGIMSHDITGKNQFELWLLSHGGKTKR